MRCFILDIRQVKREETRDVDEHPTRLFHLLISSQLVLRLGVAIAPLLTSGR